MAKPELKYVGRSVPRVDGIEKVTGQAKFLGDLVVPGMLQGKILAQLLSSCAHSFYRHLKGGGFAGGCSRADGRGSW